MTGTGVVDWDGCGVGVADGVGSTVGIIIAFNALSPKPKEFLYLISTANSDFWSFYSNY